MKKLSIKEILVPALSLFLICLVVTALLAGTNLLTKDIIAEQSRLAEEQSRQLVLPEAKSFDQLTAGETVYYAGKDDGGSLVGYVFTTESKGYGGTLKVMTGIGADAQVHGVVLLSHSETPGLGANAEKEDFRQQYQQAAPENGFEVVKATPAEGQIEAMTGATISSKAVTEAVNQAVALFHQVEKGGN